MRVIVTGGNSGVGKATATALAAAGHSVVIACRSLEKAERAAAEMRGDVTVSHLDLADLSSVRRFADSVELGGRADQQRRSARVAVDPHRRRLRNTHRNQSSRALRADLPTGRPDHRPRHLRVQRDVRLRTTRPGRPELAQPAVLEVGGLHPVETRQHAVRRRTGTPRNACLRLRPGRRGHRHHPRQQRCAGLARSAQAEGPLGCSTCSRRRRPRGPPSRPSTPNCPAGRISRRGSTSGAHPNMLSRITRPATRIVASRLWDLSAELTGCDWVGLRKGISA